MNSGDPARNDTAAATTSATTGYNENTSSATPASSGVTVRPVADRDNFPELNADDDDNTVTAAADAAAGADAVTPQDIEETRAEMGRTIDAIKEKLNPETLKEHAKEVVHDATIGKVENAVHDAVDSAKETAGHIWDSAREKMHDAGHTARGASYNMIDTIKENPLPAALAGIGIGWLIASARSSGGGNGNDRYDYADRAGRYERYPRGYESGRYSSSSGPYYDTRTESREAGAADEPGLRERAADAAHEAKERVGDAASAAWDRADRYVIEPVKENPLPAALIGIGIGWMIASVRSSGSGNGSGNAYDYRSYNSERYGATPYNRAYSSNADYRYDADRFRSGAQESDPSLRERVSGAAHEAKERVSDLADSAKERVSDVAGAVGEKAEHLRDSVSEQAHDLSYRARDLSNRASDGFERTLQDNPFAVGAIALALGVAVGLAVPETQRENRWMGDTRDRLVDQVSETAKDVASRVQDVAGDALNSAKEAAGDALATTREAAGDAFHSAKQEVKDAARDAFATAKTETKDALTDTNSESGTNKDKKQNKGPQDTSGTNAATNI